jgi:hypothetical protein
VLVVFAATIVWSTAASRLPTPNRGTQYTEQPRYAFFDYGYVVGFYCNSVKDIGPREFLPRQTPNQAIQPTAGRCTVSHSSMKTRPLQATLALANSS